MAQTQLTTTLWEGIRTGARSVVWFVRGVMGEDAYEKYLLHYESVHGGRREDEHGDGEHSVGEHGDGRHCDGEHTGGVAPPMTEREFWRDRSDRQDTNPQSRCC
jgi:uncharacterized short protein YbdD (DUF466 family)